MKRLSICGRWPLPLGLIVSPLADTGTEVPKITPGAGGIVRCRRCRAYMNPFMRWSDGGRCPGALRCGVCTMGLTQVQHEPASSSVAQQMESELLHLRRECHSIRPAGPPCHAHAESVTRSECVLRPYHLEPSYFGAAQAVPVQRVHAAQRGADGVLRGPGPGWPAPGRGAAPGAQPRDRRLRGSPGVHGEPLQMRPRKAVHVEQA